MKILQTLVEDDDKRTDLIHRMADWYDKYGNNWQGYNGDTIRMSAKAKNTWLFSKRGENEYHYGYSVKFDSMEAVEAFPPEIKYVESVVSDHLTDLSWLPLTGRLALYGPVKLEQFKHIKLEEKCILEMKCEGLKSFKGIHKIMNTTVKKIWINPMVEDSILGVLLLPGIDDIVVSQTASYALQEAVKAIQPFIGKGRAGAMDAQEAMMEREILEPFADL